MAKPHLPGADPGVTLCGLPVEAPEWSRPLPLVETPDARTCRRCARLYEPPFEPSGPYAVPPAARQVDERGLAAIARSIAGDEERRYRWRSAVQALQALAVFRVDGQGVGSPMRTSRLRMAPRDTSSRDPMRQVTDQVDRLHGVDTARRTAFTAPRTITYSECSCCGSDRICPGARAVVVGHVELSAEQQTQILDWSVEMRHLPGDPEPVALSLEAIATRALDRWGVRLTERHVTMIKSAGLRAVSAHLRAIGEMAPAERRAGEETNEMAVRGFELCGWDQIVHYTGISKDVLRRLAARESDPLPVVQIDGVRGYHARKADVDAWLGRNAQPARVAS